MKTIKACLTIFFILLLGMITAFAQEVDLTKGDLSILKGETTINFEFTYEKMSVGDFSKEADYIKKENRGIKYQRTGNRGKMAG